MNDLKWFTVIVSVAVIAVIIGWSVVITAAQDIRDECIVCGYPSHIISGGDGYCIKLEDGTEVVRPVEEACGGKKDRKQDNESDR